MRYFSYGGRSYYFDVSEVCCLTRLTKALEAMERMRTERAEKGDEKTPVYAVIASFCESILTFFKSVFGEKAAMEICGEMQSGDACAAAFLAFVAFARAQTVAVEAAIAAAEAEYAANAVSLGVLA